MDAQKINKVSAKALLALSLIAVGAVFSGYTLPRETIADDEGTGAHLFQLSIATLIPVVLVFLCTADWKRPKRSTLPLVLPTAALIVAFAALYCLEHLWLRPR